ncbi:MAG: HD domain-containing protein [Chloroflexota bacterium]
MWKRILYRCGQVWRLVWAKPLSETEWHEVEPRLNEAEAALFTRFSAGDQRHSFQVMTLLQAEGQRNQDLLTAALLHDIGKICYPIWLWERVAIVLAKVFWPDKLQAWGQGEAKGWKRPFVVREKHPAWGAQLAQEAGATPLAVELIARHQDPLPNPLQTEVDHLLAQLQWADDQN